MANSDRRPTSDPALVSGAPASGAPASRPLSEPWEGEEACLHGEFRLDFPTHPSTPPIIPAAVWQCRSPAQADELLSGKAPGYVYQRDGHPNADWLAERCAKLHRAERAAITSSGMAALAGIVLAHCQTGDRLLLASQLYGRSSLLLNEEAARLGMIPETVDAADLAQVRDGFARGAKLLVVETIANPRLQVAPLDQLAQLAHQANGMLVVDNTFATPLLCRPLEWGADLVYESVSKLMNGHGDLMMGMIAGSEKAFARIDRVIAAWGLASSPFDCWLAQRGLGTLGLRVERACRTAAAVAHRLLAHPAIAGVDYPGLESHPDHELARRLFASPVDLAESGEVSGGAGSETGYGAGSEVPTLFGHVVTVHLKGGRRAAEQLIERLPGIPFCPSLGELRTTLSHPETTSHRGLSRERRGELGITSGTIRLSIGIESTSWVLRELVDGLDSLDP